MGTTASACHTCRLSLGASRKEICLLYWRWLHIEHAAHLDVIVLQVIVALQEPYAATPIDKT